MRHKRYSRHFALEKMQDHINKLKTENNYDRFDNSNNDNYVVTVKYLFSKKNALLNKLLNITDINKK